MKKLLSILLILGTAALLFSCSAKKMLIKSDGLHYIKFGEEIPPVGAKRIAKRYALRDSILEDEDTSWRASVVKHKEGLVYLEEDFYTKELLNRIRIETPELHLRNGLKVGDTLADLMATTNKWYVYPMKKFNLYEFSSPDLYPRIHFVVDDPTVPMTSENREDYPLEGFAPSAVVKMIVLY